MKIKMFFLKKLLRKYFYKINFSEINSIILSSVLAKELTSGKTFLVFPNKVIKEIKDLSISMYYKSNSFSSSLQCKSFCYPFKK